MDKDNQGPAQALTALFQKIISDIKGSGPVWDELSKQAVKLQSQLKCTVIVLGTFLDAFQKVADLANASPGATRDVGAGLTRMCVRHRNLETKLKALASSLSECLVQPVQDSVEEWKKNAAQLDKEHSKEYKKAQQEIKKASSETLRLRKKAKKGGAGVKTEEMFDVVGEKYSALEDSEALALKAALTLQRNHFCQFFYHISPLLDREMELLGELEHMKEVMTQLVKLTVDPTSLPLSSEQVVIELKSSSAATSSALTAAAAAGTAAASTCSLLQQAQRGSQVSLSSQHSGSHQSSRNSESSGSLQSIQSALQHQQSVHHTTNQILPSRFVSSSLARIPSIECSRQISSVSSQDSGFVSQEIPTSLTSATDVTASPLISSTVEPPRSFIHPDLHMMYADSPDRGFTAGAPPDGFSVATATTKRPHTISATYGHARVRPGVTSEVFLDQSQDKSYLTGEGQQKRGSMPPAEVMSDQHLMYVQQIQQQYADYQQQHLTLGQQQECDKQCFSQQLHNQQPQRGYSHETVVPESLHDGGSISSILRPKAQSMYEQVQTSSLARNLVKSSATSERQSLHSSASSDHFHQGALSRAEDVPQQQQLQLESRDSGQCGCGSQSSDPPLHRLPGAAPVIMRKPGGIVPSSASHYAVPNVTGIRRSVSSEGSSSDGSVTAEIYARPSLLMGRRPGAGPVPVAMPTIPSGDGSLHRCLSQRASGRISEEAEELNEPINNQRRVSRAEPSVPQLKTATPGALTSTTECINLNGLLDNIDSIILLTSTDNKQQSFVRQGEPLDNDLPPPPASYRGIELQSPKRPPWMNESSNATSSSRQSSAVDNRYNGNEDFPPPPPTMMLSTDAVHSSSLNVMSNFEYDGSRISTAVGSSDSRVVSQNTNRRQEVGQDSTDSTEDGSLLAAIRSVTLRKVSNRQC